MPQALPVRRRERLLIYQTGDFATAHRRLQSGAEETYLDQKRSVDFVCALGADFDVVVVSATDTEYDLDVVSGVRSIGVTQRRLHDDAFARSVTEDLRPDLALPRFPHAGLLAALAQRGVPAMPTFADIFTASGLAAMTRREGLRRWRLNRRLRRVLGSRCFVGVGNHNLLASVSLRDVLGVTADRILPWEWPRLKAAAVHRAARPTEEPAFRLVYAGAISEAKGVGDLLDAACILAAEGCRLHLVLFGDGPAMADWQRRADALPDSVRVEFAGLRPNSEVRQRMAAADAAVVPSRHAYAEGMPNVIFEALAATVPLVVSDHPAFGARFSDGETALVARASDPESLAQSLRRLAGNPDLSLRLRNRAAATLDRLYVGQSWYCLVSKFLKDPVNRTGWVAANSLAALSP